MQISTILASTLENVVSQINSNRNMLNTAFFNRLPKDEACTDYKEWSVNKLYTSLLKYSLLEKRQESSNFLKPFALTIVSF